MSRIIVLLLVVLAIAKYGEGCSCEMLHPQKYYCDSDYVVRGIVTKAEMYMMPDGMVQGFKYKIQIKKILKTPKTNPLNVNVGEEMRAISTGMCAFNLMENEEYMIQGQTGDGKLEFNMCDHQASVWSQLSIKERDLLTKVFPNNCRCKIFGTNTELMASMGKYEYCEMGDYKLRQCLIENSVCIYKENDRCGWTNEMYCTPN